MPNNYNGANGLRSTSGLDIQIAPSVNACFYDKKVVSGVTSLCIILAWALR